MNSDAEIRKIEQEMNETLKSIQVLGPCLEGSLKQNARANYVKKDGSVSRYPTAPILQYRIGLKKRGYRRIPLSRLGEVLILLENGRRYRAFAEHYEALSARLALCFKKKRLIPRFPAIQMANLEALLSKTWTQAVEGGKVDAGGLDAQVHDAGLKFSSASLRVISSRNLFDRTEGMVPWRQANVKGLCKLCFTFHENSCKQWGDSGSFGDYDCD